MINYTTEQRFTFDGEDLWGFIEPCNGDWLDITMFPTEYASQNGNPEDMSIPPWAVAELHKVFGKAIKFYKEQGISLEKPWSSEDDN